MKKTYQQPETILIVLAHKEPFLAGSPQRSAGGDPTTVNGKSIPINIGETAVGIDPFGKRGQGTNGKGTRSNYGLWDEEE